MQKIKNFNESNYNKAVTKALENKDNAKMLKESLVAFAGHNTIEEIENYLNEKTGFVNSQLSANAMGLESQYNTICTYFDVINLDNFNLDFTDISIEKKAELRETFTSYWSKEDTLLIEKTQKLCKSFNAMDVSIRQSIVLNRNLEFIFTEQGYSNNLAMKRRA